ncbi:DMT family transporter [Paenibacillus cellulositrophicus]|uniref:DMT family transporter n=1 Tax=Paenibacillus cellulositrophicus TaxID=562959 RepID=UPI00126772EA|nr:DMT family transporter [Paenibacillus cellulositrophicus]
MEGTSIDVFLIGTRRLVRVTLRDTVYLIPYALVGMLLHQVSFFTGLRTVDATTASLILSLSPICTALFARLFLKESFTLRMTMGSVVAFAGVFFVVANGAGFMLRISSGIGWMLICMRAFSGSVILMKKLTERIEPLVATAYSTMLGCIAVFPVSIWSEPHAEIRPHYGWWLVLIGSALLIQGLCAVVWNAQIRRVGAATASLFLNLQPFVAMVSGYFILGTPISYMQVAGSVLIICGVILATFQRRSKRTAHADQLHMSVVKR